MMMTTDSGVLMMMLEQYQAIVNLREENQILRGEKEALEIQIEQILKRVENSEESTASTGEVYDIADAPGKPGT